MKKLGFGVIIESGLLFLHINLMCFLIISFIIGYLNDAIAIRLITDHISQRFDIERYLINKQIRYLQKHIKKMRRNMEFQKSIKRRANTITVENQADTVAKSENLCYNQE